MLNAILFALLIGVLPASAQVSHLPPPKNNAQAAAQTAPSDKRGTPETPLAVTILPSPDAEAKAAEEKQDRDKKAATDQALADWTRSLFLATVLLAVIATGQMGLFWVQLRLMHASMKDTADIAQAAKKSAEISERSLTSLERAFVFPLKFEWIPHFDAEQLEKSWYEIRPHWKNSGRTVTKNMTTNINFALLDAPLPPDFGGRDSPRSYRAIIGPDATVTGSRISIDAEDLIRVWERRKHFFFWGWANYNDVFAGTPAHTTTFCRYITDIKGDPTKESVDAFFAMHSTYNDAD